MNGLTDQEILEYLMTSEFDDNLSPDEYKLLLLKFRYFYRLSLSKNNQIKFELNTISNNFSNLESSSKKNIFLLQIEKTKLSDELNSLYKRKLSMKEAFSRKINKENGNK